jgi:hypothetical protein
MAEAVTFRLDPDSNAHEAQVCPEDLELFAELIVRECADLFDKNETDIRIPEYQIHDSIMIHFGLY